MSQEIGFDGSTFGLGGGNRNVILSKAFEKGADVVDVGGRVRIEDDDVFQVGGDAIEAFDDFINDLRRTRRGRHYNPVACRATGKVDQVC